MKVYLSGQMSGIPFHNFPAFERAAAQLRANGYDVVSPVELDLADGIKPGASGDPLPDDVYNSLLDRDLDIIANDGIDAVVVMEGWEGSHGAGAEVSRALQHGIRIMTLAEALQREVRVVNEETGGEKGRKPQRYSLIPYAALDKIAEVYHYGAQKYEPFNWRKGYDWSLSFDAALRHLAAFVEGENLDPESTLPHLAHAGFHILALLTFMDEHPELDDRYGS